MSYFSFNIVLTNIKIKTKGIAPKIKIIRIKNTLSSCGIGATELYMCTNVSDNDLLIQKNTYLYELINQVQFQLIL